MIAPSCMLKITICIEIKNDKAIYSEIKYILDFLMRNIKI